MSISRVLTDDAVFHLPPMLFGRIRWQKSLGAPVGDPATGFKVLAEEHTATQFQEGADGIEPVPGTGVWRPAVVVPCNSAPDEGDRYVVAFNVPDVHLTPFPDGKYRVSAQLTGNWAAEPHPQWLIGYKRLEPLSYYVSLTKDQHIVSVDFEVVEEPLRWRP